jgi:tRNA1Val (adenine37-N6)-methyltransferase
MKETSFHFKYFTVHQDKCAMKVGTDGVLLGAWVDVADAKTILDIGTGTGLISLMLAQKSFSEIHAVDIEENAYNQARENFLISPWYNRLIPFHQSFQEFAANTKSKYDLIVSNPPYFHHASKPPEESRTYARHDDHLTFEELIRGVKKVISDNGRFCVILPYKEGIEFMDMAMRNGLFCRELMKVRTKAEGLEKRVMMEFHQQFGSMNESCLTIKDKNDHFTSEYIELTKDYFLNLEHEKESN